MNTVEQNEPLRGQLVVNPVLAEYTTWRVGGLARAMYKPADFLDLGFFLKQLAPEEPVIWLGLGSNSLIHDAGYLGTVILTQGCLNGLTLLDDRTIRVEAGVSCAKMARFCARNALSGAEFWAGIPGTMGGALRMNAGCFDAETWQSVIAVETMTRDGVIRHRSPSEFEIAYRHVSGLNKDEWFIAATCRFSPGNKDTALQRIKTLLAHRAATQPTSEYNCGSVFRNPVNHYAAQLIESCGLKGTRLGGAMVSNKHANFIINDHGSARARDIADLIELVQQRVYAQHGVELVREIHFIGDEHVEVN